MAATMEHIARPRKSARLAEHQDAAQAATQQAAQRSSTACEKQNDVAVAPCKLDEVLRQLPSDELGNIWCRLSFGERRSLRLTSQHFRSIADGLVRSTCVVVGSGGASCTRLAKLSFNDAMRQLSRFPLLQLLELCRGTCMQPACPHAACVPICGANYTCLVHVSNHAASISVATKSCNPALAQPFSLRRAPQSPSQSALHRPLPTECLEAPARATSSGVFQPAPAMPAAVRLV